MTTPHPSGLFTYAEKTRDKQGVHYTGGVLLRDASEAAKAGMKVDFITEIGALLLGWKGKEVVFQHFLPFRVHDAFGV